MSRAIALLLLLPVAIGCQHGRTATPTEMASTDDTSGSRDRISLEKLQEEMLAYTRWHNDRLKAVAARIEAEAPNERVRYETLRLKTEIIQTQRQVAMSRDPRDAFTDSWVYVVQRRNYLLEGGRDDIMAPWHDKVVLMTEDLTAELERIGGLFMTAEELASAEAAVEAYAREHPTLGVFDAPDARPSARARKEKNNGLGAIINAPLAPFSALHGIDAGAAAVGQIANAADRLTALAAELPEQVRWQAELYDYGLLNREPLKTTLEDFHRVSRSLDRVTAVIEDLPEDVRTQVEDVFDELEGSADSLQATLKQAQATADAFTATAQSADQLVQSAAALLNDAGVTGAESGPSDPGAPSEVEQLTTVARETRSTVVEARGLVADLDQLLLDSTALDDRILAVDQAAGASVDRAAGRVRELIRFATLQGVLLIGVALVAAILYRVVAVRLIKPR